MVAQADVGTWSVEIESLTGEITTAEFEINELKGKEGYLVNSDGDSFMTIFYHCQLLSMSLFIYIYISHRHSLTHSLTH